MDRAKAARQAIEPDLIRVFRLFMVAQVVVLALWAWVQSLQPEPPLSPYQWLAVIVPALLVFYFSWTGGASRMGHAYLPVALIAAAAGQLVVYAAIVRMRMAHGIAGDALLRDAWLLIVALLLPSILVAWQYGLRAVVLFCVATVLLDVLLLLPTASQGGPRPATIVGVALVRILFFLPVGYAVARLVAAQRAQREALAEANQRLARQAVTLEQLAVSRERNRLARELHDTLAHTLSGLAIQLEAINSLWATNLEHARALLGEALAGTRSGLRESRRAIQALRATPLAALGLVNALRELSQSAADRAGVTLRLDLPESIELSGRDAEQTIYRVAEEAIANVVRHANASTLHVRLDTSDAPTLTITDDGSGFDPTQVDGSSHFGLRGMRERAALAGGALAVQSTPGGGTTLRLIVPRES